MHNNASKIMIEHPDMTQSELKGVHAMKEINHPCLDPIDVLWQLTKQGDVWRKFGGVCSVRKSNNQVLKVFKLRFPGNKPD